MRPARFSSFIPTVIVGGSSVVLTFFLFLYACMAGPLQTSPRVDGVGGDSRVGRAKMPAKLMRPWRLARGGAWRRSSTCTLVTKAARTTMLRWVMRPGSFSQRIQIIFERHSPRRLWSTGALILAVVLTRDVKEFDRLFSSCDGMEYPIFPLLPTTRFDNIWEISIGFHQVCL